MTNVPEKLHAQLGASSAHRWMACPGSVKLSSGRPTYETEHSRAGTAAHHIAEKCLNDGIKAKTFIGMELEGVEVDEHMAEAVQIFVDYCTAFTRMPGAKVFIEKQFSLGKLNPPGQMFGTTDFAAYLPGNRQLHVVDYKNGSGVVVEAVGNPQLRYYGLGALLALQDELGAVPVDEIILTIVQPNAFHPAGVVRSDHISYTDLLDFADELLAAAKRTGDPDAPLVAGSHCRFCPASAICSAQREFVQDTAQLVFAEADETSAPPAPESLSPEALSHIMRHLGRLEQWAADVRAYARQELERGAITSEQLGYKIVEGRATRRWASDGQIEKWLREKGYADEEIYTSKLKSPAQVEKLMGKDKKSIPSDFVTVERGLQMVPNSDKREAVALAAPDVFEALPPGSE